MGRTNCNISELARTTTWRGPSQTDSRYAGEDRMSADVSTGMDSTSQLPLRPSEACILAPLQRVALQVWAEVAKSHPTTSSTAHVALSSLRDLAGSHSRPVNRAFVEVTS